MSTPGASVNLVVEAHFKAIILKRQNAMPTILSIEKLVKAIAQVATIIKTSMCTGLHICLDLVLKETKIHHVANDPALNCDRMDKPMFTNPYITPLTDITDDKQHTNKHKVTWDEYHLQEAVILHGRAAIVAAIMT